MGPLVYGKGSNPIQLLFPLGARSGDGEAGHGFIVGYPDREEHVGQGGLGVLGVGAAEVEHRRSIGEFHRVPAGVRDRFPIIDGWLDPEGDGEVAQPLHDPLGQTDVLGLIQQQLDAGNRTAVELAGALGELRIALSSMAQSNDNASNVLSKIAEDNRRRDSQMAASIGRLHGWIVTAVVCCAAASALAIAVALIALLA